MNKPVSRQRLYQIKLKAEGRCGLCGKDLHPILKLCEPCAEKSNIRTRNKKGFNEKVHGGPGRPRIILDETGTYATTEIELKMSKANYSLSNRALSEDMQVSQTTIAKYRAIFAPTMRSRTDVEHKMAKADYSLSNKELMYDMKVANWTVAKYRSIFAPETVMPPRAYKKKPK